MTEQKLKFFENHLFANAKNYVNFYQEELIFTGVRWWAITNAINKIREVKLIPCSTMGLLSSLS